MIIRFIKSSNTQNIQDSYLELPASAIQGLGARNLEMDIKIQPRTLEDSIILLGESVNSRRKRRDTSTSFVLLAIQDEGVLFAYSCGGGIYNS